MKIAILSRNPSLYSTQRLQEASARRGHDVRVIDYLRCYMNITAHPSVMYQGQTLDDFDAIIPRIGASHTCYGAAVVRQFEIISVLCANDAEAITRSHDKLRCLQLLAQQGISLPRTGVAHSSKDLGNLLRSVGGAPLVVKLLNGTPGIGAILAETEHAAESVLEAFQGLDANSLVQQFVKDAAGTSLRCLVVGRRVVASMKRTAPEGEFRSNLHRGGRAEKVKLSPQERRTALLAAQTMGLKVAGVDMLRSAEGPLVMAVNSTPELECIERTTRVDVAGKIIEFLEAGELLRTPRDWQPHPAEPMPPEPAMPAVYSSS